MYVVLKLYKLPTQPASKKITEKINEADADVKPIERAVEARSTDDAFGTMVRCLYFARTFLVSSKYMSPRIIPILYSSVSYIKRYEEI